MPRTLEALLALAATAVAVAFFASVPYWPEEWTEKPVPEATPRIRLLLGPSVLASLAPARAVPELTLPDDLASVVQRISPYGETGLIAPTAVITTFRLRATGDLVALSAPLGIDPVQRVRTDTDVLRVRGAFAVASIERGSTVLRWTEDWITYEISSRTLDASRLVEVANRLR